MYCDRCDCEIVLPHVPSFCYTVRGEEEATKENTLTVTSNGLDCLQNINFTSIRGKCTICRKDMTTCSFSLNSTVSKCSHCFVLPFAHLNFIVHKPCCSLECYTIERKKVEKDEHLSLEYQCDGCGKLDKKMKKCSRCKLVYYCSVQCQKNRWNIHKRICK